jgi:hypothetical protein
MPGLVRYSSLSSHAEMEVVVKQICFYGAKHCETDLIRAWHTELVWGRKLADGSIVSGAGICLAVLPISMNNLFHFKLGDILLIWSNYHHKPKHLIFKYIYPFVLPVP